MATRSLSSDEMTKAKRVAQGYWADGKSLYFSISEELLWGNIGTQFTVKAYSGNGRTTHPDPDVSHGAKSVTSSSRPGLFTANTITSGNKMRGGVIPPGVWLVNGIPFSKKDGAPTDLSFQLYPISDSIRAFYKREYDKSKFYIHGAGPKGSDGCILLPKPERERLKTCLGGYGYVYLTVVFNTWEVPQTVDKTVV